MKHKCECWMMVAPHGRLIHQYAGYRRVDSIAKLTSNMRDHWTWKELYRKGWRAVRVVCREI